MAKTQTSDKAKEANRRRVAKHREKQQQQATLQSLLRKGEMNLFPKTGTIFTILQPLQKQGMKL